MHRPKSLWSWQRRRKLRRIRKLRNVLPSAGGRARSRSRRPLVRPGGALALAALASAAAPLL